MVETKKVKKTGKNKSVIKNNTRTLTKEHLEENLTGNNCCGKEMIVEETHEEKNNKVCYKYVCSQCNSSLFDYREKPVKKPITLTANEYEDLLSQVRNIHQKLYEIKLSERK